MDLMDFAGLAGGGVLAIWSDAAAEHDEEFNNWYTSQHLPERTGIAGFRRGRRYQRDEPGEFRYFTLYETADTGVLASGPYLERLNSPTAWTRRVLPYFRSGSRLAMAVTSSAGGGLAGLAATIRFGPAEGAADGLRAWVVTAGTQLREARPDLTGWHLCESDDQATRAKAGTAEAAAGRPGSAPPAPPPAAAPQRPWMLMVEAARRDALAAAGKFLASPDGLQAHGATDVRDFGVYQLMLALTSPRYSLA